MMWPMPIVHDDYMFDMAEIASLLRSTHSNDPKHRSPGGRAHRRWRKRRASGRA